MSLSAADRRYASKRLPKDIEGVPVVHLEWKAVQRLARKALSATRRREERLWLEHLALHLETYVSMQNRRDNLVYVVALGAEAIHKSGYTWIDVVEQNRQYFDLVGGTGRLKVPPNYLGFRYRGELQSVHYVESCRIVADLSEVDPRWPTNNKHLDHFVFGLGPAIKPPKIKSGADMHARRAWCAIDTLLSGEFKTVAEAAKATKARLEAGDLDD